MDDITLFRAPKRKLLSFLRSLLETGRFVLEQRQKKPRCRNLRIEWRNLQSLAEGIKGSKSQKVSCLSSAHGKKHPTETVPCPCGKYVWKG